LLLQLPAQFHNCFHLRLSHGAKHGQAQVDTLWFLRIIHQFSLVIVTELQVLFPKLVGVLPMKLVNISSFSRTAIETTGGRFQTTARRALVHRFAKQCVRFRAAARPRMFPEPKGLKDLIRVS